MLSFDYSEAISFLWKSSPEHLMSIEDNSLISIGYNTKAMHLKAIYGITKSVKFGSFGLIWSTFTLPCDKDVKIMYILKLI